MRKKRIITNGYIQTISEDKVSNISFSDYEYEHKIVAEKMLGRKLTDKEVVHHLDENRSNNSPDNLLILEES